MGASSTGLKSYRSDRVEDQNRNSNIPRMSVEDLENNNSHIYVNPQDDNNLTMLPIHTVFDECDLNNNRTASSINHSLYTVSLHSKSATTILTSFNEYDKLAHCRLSEQKIKVKPEKMAKTKKGSKKKCDEKSAENEKKKKAKPKSKPPRPAAAGSGGKRGMAEQDQMRRPRKKTNTRTEK